MIVAKYSGALSSASIASLSAYQYQLINIYEETGSQLSGTLPNPVQMRLKGNTRKLNEKIYITTKEVPMIDCIFIEENEMIPTPTKIQWIQDTTG